MKIRLPKELKELPRLRRSSKKPPGQAPGTLQAHPSAKQSEVHVFAYSEADSTEHVITDIEEIPRLLESNTVTWVNVYGLGNVDLIARIAEIFDLHRLAVEDVVSIGQRAKIEEFSDHLFLTAQMVTAKKTVEYEQISLFLGSNYVLTFQEHLGDNFDAVRERLRQKRPIRSFGADYLAYALLDAIIDHYFPVLDKLESKLGAAEDRVIAETGREIVQELHLIKRELRILQRILSPLREVIIAMRNDETNLITDNTKIYLRDCADHVERSREYIEMFLGYASDLMDLCFSTNDHRMNEIMQTLTVMAAIFIPLTFIAGIYGMNFTYMPELQFRYGYFVCLALMGISAAALLFYFWRKGWLGSRYKRNYDGNRNRLDLGPE